MAAILMEKGNARRGDSIRWSDRCLNSPENSHDKAKKGRMQWAAFFFEGWVCWCRIWGRRNVSFGGKLLSMPRWPT